MLPEENKQQRCVKALQNAAGYLQQKVSNRLDLRYTPKLTFVLDQGIKNSFAVTRILEEVLPQESANEDGETAENEAQESSEEMTSASGNSLPLDESEE